MLTNSDFQNLLRIILLGTVIVIFALALWQGRKDRGLH
jgi:hypothetical protein